MTLTLRFLLLLVAASLTLGATGAQAASPPNELQRILKDDGYGHIRSWRADGLKHYLSAKRSPRGLRIAVNLRNAWTAEAAVAKLERNRATRRRLTRSLARDLRAEGVLSSKRWLSFERPALAWHRYAVLTFRLRLGG